MRALLDVNMLLALLDGGHLHHAKAEAWMAANHKGGWASCPLTQNGCLRVMSLPGYPNSQPVAVVAERLDQATRHSSHEFWPDALSLLGEGRLHWDRMLKSNQVTDIYLLALAVKHKARLVTLDQGIALGAVRGASTKNLVILK